MDIPPPWADLPYPVLKKIASLLPISDVVSFAKTCESWKMAAIRSLKSIRIDESSPFGGSWKNFNDCCRPVFNRPSGFFSKHIDSLARDLATITDGIEHLSICTSSYDLPLGAYKALLSSQKEIKTLEVYHNNNHTRNDEDGADWAKEARFVLSEGILRHEPSLETITVCIEMGVNHDEELGDLLSDHISFKYLIDRLGDKPKYFPNLKSVKFLASTLSASFTSSGGTEERQSAELFFERTFRKNKILKLNIDNNLTSEGFVKGYQRVFFSYFFTTLITNYFKAGCFRHLRDTNIEILNSGDRKFGLSMDEADMLIQCCPDITRISSVLLPNFKDETGFLKVIKHYGPQLTHLLCNESENIKQHIAQYCGNLESLGLFYNCDPCLCALKNLKKLEMKGVTATALSRIGNVLGGLTDLEIGSVSDDEVLDVIQRNAKNLQSLKIEIKPETWESFTVMIDKLVQFLKEFHCLKIFHFLASVFCRWSFKNMDGDDWKGDDEITELLVKNQLKLKELHIDLAYNMSTKNKVILIERMPFCNIMFETPFAYG